MDRLIKTSKDRRGYVIGWFTKMWNNDKTRNVILLLKDHLLIEMDGTYNIL